MCNKTVSIVIPVYNGENYLSEAIESAINQTYPFVEVIVVDDGSIDNTAKICRFYKDKIRYLKKDNGGVASAVNYGIKHMRGEYFSWLSHDDIYHLDKIEKQIIAIQESDNPFAIVHGNYNVVNESYHSTTIIRNDLTYKKINMENSVMPILVAGFHGCVPLVHKSHFDRVGLFDESLRLTQDFDFFFRALRGQKSIFLSEPLVDVRIHEQAGRKVNTEFEVACARQYLDFAKMLSKSEVKQIFREESIFYFRTAAMMCSRNMFEAAWSLLKEYKCENATPYGFKEKLEEQLGLTIDNIYIFGMGFRGKTLLIELLGRNIEVKGFIDNNKLLQGTTFSEISCISIDEVNDKNEITVFVAPDDSASIINQLKAIGIFKIVKLQQMESLLLEYPPTNIEVVNHEMEKQRT